MMDKKIVMEKISQTEMDYLELIEWLKTNKIISIAGKAHSQITMANTLFILRSLIEERYKEQQ